MKLNKNIIYLLKVVFGVAIIYLIYKSIYSEKNLENLKNITHKINSETYLLIGIVFLLQFVNWTIEAIKFKYILKKEIEISLKDSVKSVYIGNATSLFTPDRIGNFIGRFLYFKKIKKTLITSSTLLGNFAQLITTFSFALLSSILIMNAKTSISLPLINHNIVLIFIVLLLSSFMYLFFNPKYYLKLIYKIKWIRKYKESINYLQNFNKKESIIILLYSYLRYLIFILQFYLLLNAFGLTISILDTLIFSGLLYLFTTLIPSPFMGNLGTREYISIMLLSSYKYPEIVLLASLSIWIINIAIPSLIGSYFLLKLNDSKNKV
jgi:hypothetical protein